MSDHAGGDAQPELPARPDPDGAAPSWSLELRLRQRLLLVLGGIWLIGSLLALGGAWYETSEVLDSSLREMGERLLYLPDLAGRDAQNEYLFQAEIGAHEELVVYQVYDAFGQMRMRSHSAPVYPLDDSGQDGIREVGDWRVFSLGRDDHHRRVQVAETVAHRREVMWASVGWLFAALALLLPSISIALAMVLRRGFATLGPARRELAARRPDDYRPVSVAQAPLEMRDWLQGVNAMMARNRMLIDAERSFAARSAHELRTPLAAARAQAQRLAQSVTDPAQRNSSLALVRQLDRLTRLATRLLQLARIESQTRVVREPVNLGEIARLVVDEFPEAIASERLRLEVTGESGGVVGDVDAIGIALRNLIDNALKHGGERSWVTVMVEPLTIFVINDGPGVPPGMLAKLMRPFERGITAAEGTGLGLSITQAIVRQAGGTLELISPIAGDRGFAAIIRFD